MGPPHVCYLALAAAPWLAIAGALAALCGLLACADPGQAAAGGAALASAVGAWLLALELLRAGVAAGPRRAAPARRLP